MHSWWRFHWGFLTSHSSEAGFQQFASPALCLLGTCGQTCTAGLCPSTASHPPAAAPGTDFSPPSMGRTNKNTYFSAVLPFKQHSTELWESRIMGRLCPLMFYYFKGELKAEVEVNHLHVQHSEKYCQLSNWSSNFIHLLNGYFSWINVTQFIWKSSSIIFSLRHS